MATADSLERKALAEKKARAEAEKARLAEAKKRVAKLRAAKGKYDFKLEGDKTKPRLMAYEKGTTKEIGSLTLNNLKNNAREIESIYVADTARRKGLGTALYLEAKRLGLKPAHSPLRTEAGDAFAKNVGGTVPTLGRQSGIKIPDAYKLRQEAKKANKDYGKERAKRIAQERAFRRKIGLDTAPRPAPTKVPVPGIDTPAYREPPKPPRIPGVTAGLNAITRMAGPLGMLGFVFDAAGQIANTKKPALNSPQFQF